MNPMRVYSFARDTAHLLAIDQSTFGPALCGTLPTLGSWLGTTYADESSKAAHFPLCEKCEQINAKNSS